MSLSSEMEFAKPSAPPDLKVRFDSCNESAIMRWLSISFDRSHQVILLLFQKVLIAVLANF